MAVLAAASLVFVLAQWRAEQEMLAREEATLAGVVAANAADALSAGQPGKVQVLLDTLRGSSRSAEAEFVDSQGRILARFARSNDPEPAGGARLGVVRAPVMVRGEKVGEVVLRAYDVRLASLFPRYLAVGGALFFAATGLALLMGQWLAARAIEPVERLSRAMQAVTEHGRYDRSVEVDADDEIGRLTDSFNDLLARLDANDRDLRAAMEQLVQARDAAEAANVLKSHFLANMSHEIRTPLNGVLAMAQIMAMGELSSIQQERLDVIRHSGEALLAILNDLLDLSKIEAGKMELELAGFDTADLARTVHAGFSPLAEAKGLDFRLEIAAGAAGRRVGDAARLSQILNNLISNALKFTAHGEVAVRLEGLEPDGEAGLRIVVADTGVGVPLEKQPFLFQKFTQADSSTTRRFGGTGLGLAICRELAHLMGGSIAVESQKGRGSTFTVELPLRRIGAEAEPAEPVAAPAIQRVPTPTGTSAPVEPSALRVLAAEDNATNQLVLSTVLQTFGVELVMVADGRAAVEAWGLGDFDVILMDIQMPEMDGLAATRAIRAAELAAGRARTPIVAVSANAMTHQVKEYLEAGMDAHVAKPIELASLHEALERALSAGQPAPEEEAA